jgi:hypothetical protein
MENLSPWFLWLLIRFVSPDKALIFQTGENPPSVIKAWAIMNRSGVKIDHTTLVLLVPSLVYEQVYEVSECLT